MASNVKPISVEEARGRLLEQRHATAESSWGPSEDVIQRLTDQTLITLLERGEIIAGVDENDQLLFMRPAVDADRTA